jgi:hypothetical protein
LEKVSIYSSVVLLTKYNQNDEIKEDKMGLSSSMNGEKCIQVIGKKSQNKKFGLGQNGMAWTRQIWLRIRGISQHHNMMGLSRIAAQLMTP